jgi:hypothetical protein
MIYLAVLNHSYIQDAYIESENCGFTQTGMVTWAECLDVLLEIVITDKLSHLSGIWKG